MPQMISEHLLGAVDTAENKSKTAAHMELTFQREKVDKLSMEKDQWWWKGNKKAWRKVGIKMGSGRM